MIPTINEKDILFADAAIVVINKAADLLSVPGLGEEKQDCVWRRVQQRFATAKTVHRLDYATSGVMVLALTAESHRHISIQFQERQTDKVYQAVVAGKPDAESGLVDQPLRCDWDNRPLQIIDHQQGKSAQTHWQVIEALDNASRLELKPITGRSHQLRVHMQHLGHPILGDRFYASSEQVARSPRLLLHAQSLSFNHPVSGERLSFTTATPF
ncbi:RluA family pseudouridine synthase [Amphritea japonica]|uniref:Pseudouridine synthase n=1 Tax=Amphritea japonica ATCC BAA-1530 TaxID=1278309 RepID=A0A7R6P2Z0_9GAMM|nr:RluA family pseudouridine synthase [Amphritea japonica]BBB26044.1 tRNA pseudouridine32 synthase/23S rRNA pseudouridine746 synthase [Amphritea japonica ATCC BAA-1530]